MRAKLICFLLVAAMFLAPLLTAGAAEEKAEETSKGVAKVNGTVISEAELNRELSMIQQRYADKGRAVSDSQLAEIRDKVLDRLVRRELIYGESKKEGVKVEPSEIEETFQMVKARFSDDDSFKQMLDHFNLTEDLIRRDLARKISIEKLIDERFAKDITVSEEEAKQYYDQNKDTFLQPESVHASHILIKVAEDATPEEKEKARQRIEEIKKKVNDGGDFAALAKEYSEGPSAPNGGDLGFFRRGQMVKPFEDAAFALKPGEISDVVETRFGFHLIKVMERNEESTIPFEDLKERLTAYLKQEKLQSAVNNYVEELKKSSDIVIY